MQVTQNYGKANITVLFALSLLSLSLLITACSAEEKPKPEKPEVLTEIKDGMFTEYYPGKKNIKFQGMLNANNQREGKWVFYAENGTELSITFYENGKKDGHTIVKYPNGALYYYGEFNDDQKTGVWKTYGTDGKLVDSTDFGVH